MARTEEKERKVAKLSKSDWEKAHAAAMARGAQCDRCPLSGLRAGPVLGEIKTHARLMIVGEAPGVNEIEKGRPFVGASGRVLDEALTDGGLSRSACSTTNAALCQAPEELGAFMARLNIEYELAATKAKEAGEPPPPRPMNPIEACRPRLERDIAESGAKTVLAVGRFALSSVADHYKVPYGDTRKIKAGETRIGVISKQIGAPVTMPNGDVVVASYHPAFAMRPGNKHYGRVVKKHITRAAEIASRGRVEWTEPTFILNPTVAQIEATLGRIAASGAKVTVDIETDGIDVRECLIRCVGIGAVIDGEEVVIAVPVRRIDGLEWWSAEDKRLVARALMSVLNHNELVGHNFAFDSAVLLRIGLMQDRDKTWNDTLILHRNTLSCDLPHNLGFVAAEFFEAPAWKSLVDDKLTDGVDDALLHLYCCRDVLGTLRLEQVLQQEIVNCGTQDQAAVDRALGPHVRDMGELGLTVDEQIRGDLSRKLNAEVKQKRTELRELVGDEKFNPGSTFQVRKWLYGKKGYRPQINPRSKPWKEGDDPSTSTAALLKLQDKGVDEEASKFIDLMIEFRAWDKLRGTYVDNLRVRFPNWEQTGIDVGWVGEVAVDGEAKLPRRRALSKLHANFKQHVVSSGRLASSPNVQNIPERGKLNMRQMFIAPPGHVFVGADLDQAELRIYAIVANDRLLLKAFKEGLDPHTWNAASFYAKTEADIPKLYAAMKAKPKSELKNIRNLAKRVVFLILYGGEVDKMFDTMSNDRDRATGERLFPNLKKADVAKIFDGWHRSHPETRRWQKACAEGAVAYGYTAAAFLSRRRRFFPGGANKPGAQPNHGIQATGAEIANRALLAIGRRIPHRGWSYHSGLVCQVHDAIYVIVPEARAEEAKRILEEEMIYEHEGMRFTCEAKTGKNWSEL